MTTSSEPAQQAALRIIEGELEAVGFEIDREAKEVALSLERQIELRTRRKALEKLRRMSGGQPAEYAPTAVAR